MRGLWALVWSATMAVGAGTVWAQTGSPSEPVGAGVSTQPQSAAAANAQAVARAAKYQALQVQQAGIEANHLQAISGCKTKFAVSDCELAADREKRRLMEPIRLERAQLDAQDRLARQERAAQKLADKQAKHVQKTQNAAQAATQGPQKAAQNAQSQQTLQVEASRNAARNAQKQSKVSAKQANHQAKTAQAAQKARENYTGQERSLHEQMLVQQRLEAQAHKNGGQLAAPLSKPSASQLQQLAPTPVLPIPMSAAVGGAAPSAQSGGQSMPNAPRQ